MLPVNICENKIESALTETYAFMFIVKISDAIKKNLYIITFTFQFIKRPESYKLFKELLMIFTFLKLLLLLLSQQAFQDQSELLLQP